ncbi:hypothetical protein AYI69_g171 [Smittium culicis]|uniref:Uncharacterized protein n=1 Tax=Smittium culicis TaxID=133412 RepID=A0A1R1YTQ3_9FUNG|nr:hypothetical protein AYI69_g171 [Smittium culicis]
MNPTDAPSRRTAQTEFLISITVFKKIQVSFGSSEKIFSRQQKTCNRRNITAGTPENKATYCCPPWNFIPRVIRDFE